jgi:hypothetical protein
LPISSYILLISAEILLFEASVSFTLAFDFSISLSRPWI